MSDIIRCTNHLCGKEYHIDFAKCPFCGTDNPHAGVLNERLVRQRNIFARKLEREKRLEEISGGTYQSGFKLLVEGGFVKGEANNVWENIPTFVYSIAIISIAGFIIVATLLFFPDFQQNEWYYWGWVSSIAGLIYTLSHIIYALLNKQGFSVNPANNKTPELLSSLNGVGTIVLGDFRGVGATHVAYVFMALIIPIIPIGCYRVTDGETTSRREGAARKTTTQYKFYGSEKWKGLEILHIYLRSYSIIILIICAIWLITLIF